MTALTPKRASKRLRQKSNCGVAMCLPALRRSVATPHLGTAPRLAFGAFCYAARRVKLQHHLSTALPGRKIDIPSD